MKGKYRPLFDWLRERDSAVQVVAVAFAEIERVLGGALPRSAREHRGWWANAVGRNNGHVWAASWLQAGWRVAHVERKGGWVRFERIA